MADTTEARITREKLSALQVELRDKELERQTQEAAEAVLASSPTNVPDETWFGLTENAKVGVLYDSVHTRDKARWAEIHDSADPAAASEVFAVAARILSTEATSTRARAHEFRLWSLCFSESHRTRAIVDMAADLISQSPSMRSTLFDVWWATIDTHTADTTPPPRDGMSLSTGVVNAFAAVPALVLAAWVTNVLARGEADTLGDGVIPLRNLVQDVANASDVLRAVASRIRIFPCSGNYPHIVGTFVAPCAVHAIRDNGRSLSVYTYTRTNALPEHTDGGGGSMMKNVQDTLVNAVPIGYFTPGATPSVAVLSHDNRDRSSPAVKNAHYGLGIVAVKIPEGVLRREEKEIARLVSWSRRVASGEQAAGDRRKMLKDKARRVELKGAVRVDAGAVTIFVPPPLTTRAASMPPGLQLKTWKDAPPPIMVLAASAYIDGIIAIAGKFRKDATEARRISGEAFVQAERAALQFVNAKLMGAAAVAQRQGYNVAAFVSPLVSFLQWAGCTYDAQKDVRWRPNRYADRPGEAEVLAPVTAEGFVEAMFFISRSFGVPNMTLDTTSIDDVSRKEGLILERSATTPRMLLPQEVDTAMQGNRTLQEKFDKHLLEAVHPYAHSLQFAVRSSVEGYKDAMQFTHTSPTVELQVDPVGDVVESGYYAQVARDLSAGVKPGSIGSGLAAQDDRRRDHVRNAVMAGSAEVWDTPWVWMVDEPYVDEPQLTFTSNCVFGTSQSVRFVASGSPGVDTAPTVRIFYKDDAGNPETLDSDTDTIDVPRVVSWAIVVRKKADPSRARVVSTSLPMFLLDPAWEGKAATETGNVTCVAKLVANFHMNRYGGRAAFLAVRKLARETSPYISENEQHITKVDVTAPALFVGTPLLPGDRLLASYSADAHVKSAAYQAGESVSTAREYPMGWPLPGLDSEVSDLTLATVYGYTNASVLGPKTRLQAGAVPRQEDAAYQAANGTTHAVANRVADEYSGLGQGEATGVSAMAV